MGSEEMAGDRDLTREQTDALNRLAREEAGGLVDEGAVPDAEVEPDGPRSLPKIVLPGENRSVTDFAREAALACVAAGRVFRKGGKAVEVDRETGGIAEMEAARFCTVLEEVAVTTVRKIVSVDGEPQVVERPKTMTKAAAELTLRCNDFIYGLKPLDRVNMVRQPIVGRDGKMRTLGMGYDEASGILTMRNEVAIIERAVLEGMDEQQRKYALQGAAGVIRAVLSEFPFVSELDMAVQVASMLSFYGSLLLDGKDNLNFVYKANKHRSGKTLLIKLVIAPVMGRVIVQPFPRDDNRLQELLNSTALGARAYLVLDDIMGHLRSEALNAFLTAQYWGFRGMHSQRILEARRYAMAFLSGHELTLSPDLAGRFLEVRLHVDVADSTEARVKKPISESYLSSVDVRSDLLSALHTIIVLWDLAGRPKGKTLRPGFEDWCRVFGGIVEFAGFGDPIAQRGDDEGTDPEFDDMKALMKDLLESFADGERMKEFTFAHLVERCIEINALSWAVEGQWKRDADTGERWFVASKKCEARLGHLFGGKYGGTTWTIGNARWLFGKQGKNRQRRYTLSAV